VNFGFLVPVLQEEYTILAIDLPFHGETIWRSGEASGKDLAAIIHELLIREKFDNSKIELLGFSLGGRIALTLFQEMPERISRLVLLAPDGLKMNFWYWLPTQTLMGNRLFKWTMKHPGWFLGMLKFGNRLELINQSIYKFVEYYIHDEPARQELYDRWTSMSKCRPNLDKIRKQLIQHAPELRLLYGKYDRIILTGPAFRFLRKADQHTRIEILDCGHQVLHAKNAQAIVNALIN
jgi:pimeloyl-ACP methyl ester carboxylesterase